ncbi:MAG: recombinase family protein [Magnetococcales bacterium]|nr:recombinase family protein [Magnetococcales bacterium]
MANVGYIRVSSYGQNHDRQLDGLKLDKVFKDTVSAKTSQRPGLDACMGYLREEDTLHVHSIDRLARNLFDLQKLVDGFVVKGITVRFYKENLTFSGDSDPMAKLMLQMMGAFAEFERTLINERRREGMAIARKKGKQIGAKPKLTHDQATELRKRATAGEQKTVLAKAFGISRQSVYGYLTA